jgi:hypothetical protein
MGTSGSGGKAEEATGGGHAEEEMQTGGREEMRTGGVGQADKVGGRWGRGR